MRFQNVRKLVIALFLLGIWLGPSLAEELIDLDEAVRAGDLSYNLISLEREKGEIARMQITRKTKTPITIIVPLGIAFSPKAEKYSSLIIGQEHLVPLLRAKTTHILKGYSLDYQKDPPRSGMALSRAKDKRYEDFAVLVGAGNELAQKRFFYLDLPPDEHREKVIQRAIWVMATNYGYNKTNLREEIDRYFGGGKAIEEIDAIADHLWEDIERTLKETRKDIAEKAEKLFHVEDLRIERSPDPEWPSDKIVMELRTSQKQGYKPFKNKKII